MIIKLARFIDLTGQRYGRLTVMYRAESHRSPRGIKVTKWHCLCDCGSETDVLVGDLRSNHTTSCGCALIEARLESNSTYNFDKTYFDVIDTREKAYWLGFIWCDGHVSKRVRTAYPQYYFQLILMESDIGHLEKLKIALKSNHPIKLYKTNLESYSIVGSVAAKFIISSNYFGSNLYNKYGLISHRYDVEGIRENVPKKFYKDLIRGVLDSDGSVMFNYGKNSYLNSEISFSTYEELVTLIQDYFLEIGLIKNKSKFSKRHKERDEYCVRFRIEGNSQVVKVLNFLYEGAGVYLDRKFKKYLQMSDMLRLKNESRKYSGVTKEDAI